MKDEIVNKIIKNEFYREPGQKYFYRHQGVVKEAFLVELIIRVKSFMLGEQQSIGVFIHYKMDNGDHPDKIVQNKKQL